MLPVITMRGEQSTREIKKPEHVAVVGQSLLEELSSSQPCHQAAGHRRPVTVGHIGLGALTTKPGDLSIPGLDVFFAVLRASIAKIHRKLSHCKFFLIGPDNRP